MLPKISVIYTTARGDCPMRERPGVNQFSVFLDSLEEQVFKEEIEVIIVDALKDVKIENSKLPA